MSRPGGGPAREAASRADDRSRWWGRPGAATAVVLVLAALAATLQAMRDRAYEPEARRRAATAATAATAAAPVTSAAPATSVTSGDVLRRAALSFESLLADVYWIRAIQHYGRTRLAAGEGPDYGRLYPLLDATTTLDPRFDAAYRYGAVFLAEPPPGGPGRPDLAVSLLRKGMANAPERWQYVQDIGFVHYWWRHDFGEAARWFARAAEMQGAPWWLRPLAASTMTEGGNRAGARTLWRRMRDSTGDAWMRAEAARRLGQLDALDEVDRYQRAADRFRARTGRAPASWRDLASAGAVTGVPLDPAGVAYELAPGTGAVTVSPRSALFPLPETGRFPGAPER